MIESQAFTKKIQFNSSLDNSTEPWIVIIIMAFGESLNMSTVLQYRKIKVSSKDEAKMF